MPLTFCQQIHQYFPPKHRLTRYTVGSGSTYTQTLDCCLADLDSFDAFFLVLIDILLVGNINQMIEAGEMLRGETI